MLQEITKTHKKNIELTSRKIILLMAFIKTTGCLMIYKLIYHPTSYRGTHFAASFLHITIVTIIQDLSLRRNVIDI